MTELGLSIWPQIVAHAQARPDDVALISGEACLNYAALIDEVHKRAARLPDGLVDQALAAHQADDIEAQPLLALYLAQDIELPLWVLAGVAVGANLLIIDTSWPESRLEKLCKDLNVTLLVGTNLSLSTCDTLCVTSQTIRGEIGDGNNLETLCRTDSLTDDRKAHMSLFTGLTSASTGPAKAYQRSEASWLHTFRFDEDLFGLKPGHVVAVPGPLGHSLFLYGFLRGLYAGAAVWVASRFAPRMALRDFARHGVSHVFAVPAYLRALLDQARAGRYAPLEDFSLVVSAGAKLPPSDITQLQRLGRDTHVAEIFGTSEQSTVALASTRAAWPDESVGKPPEGVKVSILDADGTPVPKGAVGEIFVQSKALFDRYRGQQALQIMQHARFGVSVGDMGCLDENGFVYIKGRKDRMILTSGHSIHPEPIEALLKTHDAIEEAAVLGIKDDKRGLRLCAFVSFGGENNAQMPPIEARALVRHLSSTLPTHAVPRRYFHVVRWPLTRSGKIDVHRLLKEHDALQFEALS